MCESDDGQDDLNVAEHRDVRERPDPMGPDSDRRLKQQPQFASRWRTQILRE